MGQVGVGAVGVGAVGAVGAAGGGGVGVGRFGVEVDAREVGLDPARLGRLDRHLARYVDDGALPGWLVMVARHGRVAHLSTCGMRDVEAGRAVEADTLFRMYSMTKPITSVAAMSLYEEGAFELTDPVSRFIPAFAETRVYRAGSALRPVTDPLLEPVRIWHLLTHTAGLTYGFHHAGAVDEMYRLAGFEFSSPEGLDLAGVCDRFAGLPLAFQPGTEWNYSVATDVLGRVVEVAAGMPLDRALAERVLDPLGMHDTAFVVPDGAADRLAALYARNPAADGPRMLRYDSWGDAVLRPGRYLSGGGGGGGLVSTARDYHRFTQMLARGGELDGVRVLGRRTVAQMTRNHLPGGGDLATAGRPLFAETPMAGVGFGLGVSVLLDPDATKSAGSAGEYGWGGLASTTFWVDPAEDLVVVFLTQLFPSNSYPIRSQLRQLVYQALL